MTLLQRYFWKQAFWPLIISLSALAALALLTQSLSTIDLIIENRQSALTFLYITVLALPQLIAIILPLAVFMAMLYAFNRLNVDNELVVAKTSGYSPRQIASPALRLATLALIAHLVLNLFLQPLSFRTMRKTLIDIRTDIASQMLRPGEFIRPADGLSVYIREILPSGDMADILIYDARDKIKPVTHSAARGRIRTQGARTYLTLNNGSIQSLNETGSMNLIKFESHAIDLTEFMEVKNNFTLKPTDRYIHELFRPSTEDKSRTGFERKLLAEGHARLSAPLYNIALTLLALAFLIRGEFQRMGYGRRIVVCAGLGFITRLIGFGISSAAEKSAALNAAQYVLPLSLIFFCAVYLLTPLRLKIKRRKLANA